MTSKTELAVMRSELQLRKNPTDESWEVHAMIHGSTGKRKWIKITEALKNWYVKEFRAPVVAFVLEANESEN